MNPFDKLVVYFERFPGIGARQAKRFVFHLLNLSSSDLKELSELIANLNQNVTSCRECMRYFTRHQSGDNLCVICADPNRDRQKVMVVSHDSDIPAVERSGVYDGLYFVLGGTVPLMSDTKVTNKLKTPALRQLLEERVKAAELEVILGFATNPDGENTARYIESVIAKLSEPNKYRISRLGRGLSTGSELEYSDPETIKNALWGRK